MLLTISTTAQPATDLGYLLHKHPDKVQEFNHSYGTATVFYPQADADRCTAALLMDVDPAALARSRGNSPDFSLAQYVNDRPYAASSMFAVVLGGVFSTARQGRCNARPQLADTAIPLEICLPAVPGGAELARKVFAPLGWTVEATAIPLDPAFPDWGDSRYVQLRLAGTMRLCDALNHLYVLLPVLDETKHYWVDIAEVDKLVRSGADWLAAHPERAMITRRYLANRRGLQRIAFARLSEVEEGGAGELEPDIDEEPAAVAARPVSLAKQRHTAVCGAIAASGAASVIDLGCGSGKLLTALRDNPRLTRITGVDVSTQALKLAAKALRPDQADDRQTERLQLFQAALTYTDARLRGYDAAVLMEVIEHIDPPRLPAVERVVFGDARPSTVLVTTPNVEYNHHYGLAEDALRHRDHRFEWTRDQFHDWARQVAATYHYRVDFTGIGDDDPQTGAPTQMGVFTRG